MNMDRELVGAVMQIKDRFTPVAYGVFWRVDGGEILQSPVATSEEEAKQDMTMYAEGDRKNMRVKPLYAL